MVRWLGVCRSVLLAGLVCIAPALASDATVAVAANFTAPAKEIAEKFQVASGYHIDLSFGSSGQFYTQIAQGAPFDVFLSADDERPKLAEREGLAVPGSTFTYAVGRLALFSTDPSLIDGQATVLKSGRFSHLAIANPKLAPYGMAAMQCLKGLGLADTVQDKIVTGASIAQTFQFVLSGNAELGFVAYAQVIGREGGSRWLVPESLHAPIVQDAVLLMRGRDNAAAKAFIRYLKSDAAAAIIQRYGYALPKAK